MIQSILAMVRAEAAQASRFAVAGVINTCVDFTIYAGLVLFTTIHAVLANLVAFVVAATCGYTLSRGWVFPTAARPRSEMARGVRFIGVVGLGFLLASLALAVLVWAGVDPIAAKIVAVAVSMAFNYLMISRFVFHRDAR